MGFDIKDDTVFLEFYGLPGCGKSTISHLVAEELRKRGKNVKEPTFTIDHNYSERARKILKLVKLIRFEISHPRKVTLLNRIIKNNGYNGRKIISQTANIAQKLWEYDYARVDYVIFDEGVTQSAISLAINGRDSAENERLLYSICKERMVRKIYIKVEVNTALARMALRKKHDSRIEKITNECEKKRMMREFERLCESIVVDVIIDGVTREESVDKILTLLS